MGEERVLMEKLSLDTPPVGGRAPHAWKYVDRTKRMRRKWLTSASSLLRMPSLGRCEYAASSAYSHGQIVRCNSAGTSTWSLRMISVVLVRHFFGAPTMRRRDDQYPMPRPEQSARTLP